MQMIPEVPEEIFLSLKGHLKNLPKRSAWLAAKLYEMGKMSSGHAAEFAGLSRIQFLQNMGHYGVSIFDKTDEELDQDASKMPEIVVSNTSPIFYLHRLRRLICCKNSIRR